MAGHGTVPFTADYEDVRVVQSPDGKEVVERDAGRIFRDGRGRLRWELKDEATGRTIAVLIEPASGKMAAFDSVSGERLDADSDSGGTRLEPKITRRNVVEDPSRGSEQFAPIESTDLGERVIEGLAARGRRVRLANGSLSEVWHAQALPDPPLVSTASGPSGREERRLKNVRIGEPDPGLFAALDSVDK